MPGSRGYDCRIPTDKLTAGRQRTRKPTGRAVVARGPGAVELTEVPVPVPGPGEALVEVHASGICHTDLDVLAGRYAFATFPLVPGHEVAGVVVERGPGVEWPPLGTHVGLPWRYSSCGHCRYCEQGDFNLCASGLVTGVNAPGGYQEYLLARARYLVPAPAGLEAPEVAPLMCAGLTAYTGLLLAEPVSARKVAVLGFGGLGEYATWFAALMGARVAVVSGSPAKRATAERLGAERFIDRNDDDPLQALCAWDGGPDIVVSTVPDSALPSRMPGCLRPQGKLVVLGIGDAPLSFDCHEVVDRRITVLGTSAGAAKEARGALELAARQAVRPEPVLVPLHDLDHALALAASGKVPGRVVLQVADH